MVDSPKPNWSFGIPLPLPDPDGKEYAYTFPWAKASNVKYAIHTINRDPPSKALYMNGYVEFHIPLTLAKVREYFPPTANLRPRCNTLEEEPFVPHLKAHPEKVLGPFEYIQFNPQP